jgi:hypothetical protein
VPLKNQLLIYQSTCAYLGTLGGRGIGKTRGRDCGEDGGEEETGDGGVLEGHDPGASAAFAGGSLGGRRTERTPYHCCPLASSKEEGKEHGEYLRERERENGNIYNGVVVTIKEGKENEHILSIKTYPKMFKQKR